MHIAILEDDDIQAGFLRVWLESAGHDCSHYPAARDFMQSADIENFDLLMFDWLLPDLNGDKVLLWVRERYGNDIPVIFVTSRDSEADIVFALEAGADDYLVKPVKPLELLARITALGRRTGINTEPQGKTSIGNFDIENTSQTIYSNGSPVPLTQKEFELSSYLLHNVGRLVSRDHLLESVWKRSPKINTRTIDTHISRIRNKLNLTAENGWNLKAIYQHGYRLERASSQE